MIKIIRDLCCLIMLMVLIKYAYRHQQSKKHLIKKTKLRISTLKKKITQPAINKKREEISIKKEKPSKSIVVRKIDQNQLNIKQLSQITNKIENYLKTDHLFNYSEQNQIIARTKEISSQLEHLENQTNKTAPTDKEVFKKNINRKLLLLTQKTVLLLIDLVNNSTDEVVGTAHFNTPQDGIDYCQKLLKLLI